MALFTDPVTNGVTAVPSDYWTKLSRVLNLSVFYNVENPDFGASPSNSAATNNTAIQAAITAAEASGAGGAVLLPRLYPVNGDLLVTKPISIIGCGWQSGLTLANSRNVYVLRFNPPGSTWMQGTYLGNFKLDCNGANQTTAGGGIDAFGAVWCEFDHLWITKPWHNGLFLHQDNLGGFGHHNEVTGCFFELGEQSNGGDGRALRLDQSDENYIAHNTFQDNGRVGASERNHIYDLAGLNFFHHNSFVGGGTGLKLQGPDSLADGNIFDGCKDHSVRVNGARCQVLNNKFYHLGFTGTNLDGLHVDNVADTQILDNLFNTIATIDAAGGTARSAINLSVGPATNSIIGQNRILATGMAYGTGAVIPGAGAGHLFRDNKGFTTENSGTTAFGGAVSSVTSIAHGLGLTPAAKDFKLQFVADPLAARVAWVSAITATTFTINVVPQAGGAGTTVGWQVQVL
jgi:hypothetical protein